MSQQAWVHLGVPLEELESVAGEKEACNILLTARRRATHWLPPAPERRMGQMQRTHSTEHHVHVTNEVSFSSSKPAATATQLKDKQKKMDEWTE